MSSDPDLSEEIAELVTRPASEATASSPWDRRRAGLRDAFLLPDGYRRHVAGPFAVDVSPWGLIGVRAADWLSKYAQAIHGDMKVAGRFGRLVDGAIVPIPDEDFIDAGEVLVHLPTFRARMEEEKGFRFMIDGREVAPPEPDLRRRSIDDTLRRAVWRDAAEAGQADEMAAERLLREDAEDAFARGAPLPELAASAAKGAAKSAVIAAIRKYLDGWLAENQDLAAYDEAAKQQIFLTDEETTIRILYFEFITGQGEAKRVFDERHPCVWSIRDGTIGGVMARRLAERRREALGEGIEGVVDLRPFGPVRGDVPFSPDHVGARMGEGAGALESALLHFRRGIAFAKGRPTELFVGGLVYEIDTRTAALGSSGVTYEARATNVTSLTSLFAHARTVMNVDRPDAFEEALMEAGTVLPYSSITQDFVFRIVPAPIEAGPTAPP